MTRVLIVARSPAVRARLERVVGDWPGLALAGVSSALTTTPADLVLAALDPHEDEVPADVAAAAAGSPVIVLAEEPPAGLVAEALRSGIRAVLPMDSAPAELAAAIEAAAAGFVLLHPQDVPVMIAAPALTERASDAGVDALTPREVEVLRLIADGEANKGIAWRLGISEHTVKFHVASIMSKLHASSRTEAVTLGVRRGLIML